MAELIASAIREPLSDSPSSDYKGIKTLTEF